MPGPHDIRLSPDALPRPAVTGQADVLLVVENRQAAETGYAIEQEATARAALQGSLNR
jgi:hypothetical protein